MVDDNELNALRGLRIPSPDPQAKIGAMHAALRAFDEAQEKIAGAPQGSAGPERLTSRASRLWREIMNRKLYAAPGIASLIAVPIAGVTALYLVDRQAFDLTGQSSVSETANARFSTVRYAEHAASRTVRPTKAISCPSLITCRATWIGAASSTATP